MVGAAEAEALIMPRSSESTSGARPAVPRRVWQARAGLLTLLLGLVISVALSRVCYVVNDRDESRLLRLQTKQTGTVLQVVLPTIQTPLASAAEIAATSDGDVTRFHAYMASYLGATKPFVSASLWKLAGGTLREVSVVGQPERVGSGSRRGESFVLGAARTPKLSVIGLLNGPQPRLGYAFAAARQSPTYVVYAEGALPADRRAIVQKGSPFADLNFALYLGRAATPTMLLETNAPRLPITGRSAIVVVPFGNSFLTLVAAPAARLGGALSAALWWVVAILGGIISVAAALVAERLIRRRRAAERLTAEVQDLLGQQRNIAESLQHALLPKTLPAVLGMEFAVRYVSGVNGVEIGGDWYDVIALDDQRFFFAIGDVSGRGVGAGSVMASLRFAIRGFVSEGHSPAKVLDRLTGLLSLRTDHHFATVLCGVADVARHEITIANAGHLPPLLTNQQRAEFVQTLRGPPIGISPCTPPYETVTITVPSGATLLAYTDGLVERRRESLDVGLQRLYDSASAAGSLEGLLDTIVTDLTHGGSDDDTAVLGVRWLA